MTRHADFELNEIGWWSHWAKLEWINSDGYLFYSKEFAEPLFNHGGVVYSPKDARRFVSRVEEFYSTLGLPASFIVEEHSGTMQLSRLLAERGYMITDSLNVMELGTLQCSPNPNVKVVVASGEHLDSWCHVYVSSFEEKPELLGHVKRIVGSLEELQEVRLLLGLVEGCPSGVAALFTTRRLTGAYCVGTLKEKRGRGVATSILIKAAEIAGRLGTRLVLQTFEGDGVVGFYQKLGFRVVYHKNVWTHP
jgi:GNAT superfamily N-acetyltransferase